MVTLPEVMIGRSSLVTTSALTVLHTLAILQKDSRIDMPGADVQMTGTDAAAA
jgi:hypothetical protein